STAPFANLDAAKRALGIGPVTPISWTLGIGDDASHALLLGRRSHSPAETYVLALEADRPPVEVKRLDGEPLGEIDAAIRVAGHWYVTTAQAAHELAATVVWLLDGSF